MMNGHSVNEEKMASMLRTLADELENGRVTVGEIYLDTHVPPYAPTTIDINAEIRVSDDGHPIVLEINNDLFGPT